ncbi:MAG: glycosyltransferase family 4 protein [Novosphingobium sp.]|nr:glycosyltransferase family 4 protein [Novosphingobium sp.]
MARAVIIQRVVPHYRVALFEQLHKRLGWRVVCGEGGPSHGLETAAGDDHEWLISIPFRRSRRNQYRVHASLDKIMRATSPEALVCEFSPQFSLVWRLVLLGSPVPLAFWSQGWNRERGFTAPVDRLVQNTRLRLMRRADAQLVYSDESAAFLHDRLGSDMPVFVARNTLAIESFPGRGIDESPRDPAAPHVISVGRLTPDKHVPRVVEAFLKLRQAFPGARMTVVGDGPDRAAVEAVAAAGQGSVTMAGAVYDEDAIGAMFRSASLLVVGGSVGLSVNHALAYGVPVMIFDDSETHRHHPEHAYVVDGVTGFRVKGEGTQVLAEAMRDALAAPGPRAKLGKSLMEFGEKELSLERMIDGFVRLDAHFDKLLKSGRN